MNIFNGTSCSHLASIGWCGSGWLSVSCVWATWF
jgi:hypothetical protein